MTDKKLHRLVLAALFTALTTVMTMVIQVPSPMQGYVNLGDCGVLLSAWVLAPRGAERRRGSAPCWPTCSPATPTTPRAPW